MWQKHNSQLANFDLARPINCLRHSYASYALLLLPTLLGRRWSLAIVPQSCSATTASLRTSMRLQAGLRSVRSVQRRLSVSRL